MERLTNSIASKVSNELKLDNDNKEIIAYGIFAMLHMALSIILIIIFGIIFHVAIEALIVCFTGSILRKYSGGAHASSPSNCAAIGTIICTGQALLFLFLVGPILTPGLLLLMGIGSFILSYYLIYRLAPVDSPEKPIKREEKKARMKKGSIIILSAYIIIVVVNVIIYTLFNYKKFLVYSLCIYGGTLWQAFTLTKLGHSTINKMDAFLNHILKI